MIRIVFTEDDAHYNRINWLRTNFGKRIADAKNRDGTWEYPIGHRMDFVHISDAMWYWIVWE